MRDDGRRTERGPGDGTDAAGTPELDPLPMRIRSGETQTLAIKLP